MLLFGGVASSIASLLLFVTMLAATYTHYALGEPVPFLCTPKHIARVHKTCRLSVRASPATFAHALRSAHREETLH